MQYILLNMHIYLVLTVGYDITTAVETNYIDIFYEIRYIN